MASDQDFKSYLKLAKLHAVMSGTMYYDRKLQIMASILNQEGDINYKLRPNTNTDEVPSSDLVGCAVLHLSHRKRFVDKVKFFNLLLNRGADITSTNSNGQTVLQEFIHNISLDDCNARPNEDPYAKASLSAHLRFQVTANPVDRNGLSHFHAACITNDVKAIEFFLDNGVSVQQSVNADSPIFAGYTPLHFATKYVCLDAVKLLLQRGAKVDAQDAKKLTSLHVIISNILSHGEENAFPLDECFDIIGDITDNDKNVNAQDHLGLSRLHVLCTFKDVSRLERHLNDIEDVNHAVNADSPLCPGFTSLHFAALFNLESVKLLVTKGGDITIKDADQKTPLDLCIARYDIEHLHDTIVRSVCRKVILSNGKTTLADLLFFMLNPDHFNTLLRELGDVNVHIPVDSPLWPSHTLLHLAVIFHKRCSNVEKKNLFYDLIEECLKNGAEVSTKGVRDQTPLQFAFRHDHAKAVKLMLVYHRAASNPVDADGLSHLHIACAADNEDVVEALLANGADVNGKLDTTSSWCSFGRRVFFCSGSTPLHVAVALGNCLLVKRLLDRGADLQARDANGWTAIHRLITSSSHRLGLELLYSSELRECVVDGCGLSHLHVACLMGHPAAVKKLLHEYGAQVDRAINCKATSQRPDDAYARDQTRVDRYGDPSVEALIALAPYAGFTPLHLAIQRPHNAQTLKLLLEHGADMLAESSAGSVPLYSVMSGAADYLYWRNFVATLKRDDGLRRRVKRVSGSTDLHLACFGRELRWVRNLLAAGADVNARIRDDSPFWPGHTPLHVLLANHTVHGREDEEAIFQLLLSHGADVAISDGQFTPLHLASTTGSSRYGETSLSYKSSRATSMIRSISDFSRNPTTHEGVSHFHIACNCLEVDAVAGFLKHGVNINAKIDYFSKHNAGCTPLHVALLFGEDMPSKVKIVELLLKHGADVRAEDVFENTPLHCAVENRAGEQILRLILDAGADVNATNVNGATPLEMLLKKCSVEMETIEYFIESGCEINSFNSISDECIIAMILAKLPNNKDVTKLIVTSPNITKLDEMGRSAIHNMVSTRSVPWDLDYSDLIEKLEKLDCDVDHQDEFGRTALHTAVQFRNNQAITALLAAGADINITNSKGQTAYTDAVDLYEKDTEKNHRDGKCNVVELFTTHLRELQRVGVHISAINERAQDIGFMVDRRCRSLLFQGKIVKVGSRSLTLDDLIDETSDVQKYSKMTRTDREVMGEYFRVILRANNEEKLGRWRWLFKLQYRNLLARPKLIESAIVALNVLVNVEVPDLCSRVILASLENWELRNVIEAGNE